MRKLFFLITAFSLVLSCSSDETSIPVTPPAPIVKYTITLSAGEGGTVSSIGGEYEAGQTVSVTATPQGEYLFKDWSDGNTNATRTITVSSNSTITANFEKRKYPLTVNFEGEGEVIEEIVNSGRTTEYDSGTTVKLTAQAAAEWVFVGWTGDIESTEESVQIVIGEPKEVTATFEKKKYPLTVNIEGEGVVIEEIIDADRTTDYDSGTTVKLTAQPADEWLFTGWSGDIGDIDPTGNPIQLNIIESKTVTATFEKKKYPLTVNIEGEGEVLEEIVNTGRTTDYDSGTTVKLTAVPAEGWEFVGWTGAIESAELEVQLLVSEAKTISATFNQKNPIYQTIYNSSTLNHEWNSGYFNELTMKWDYAFNPSFTYLDYDNDGDMDIFAMVWDNIQSGPVQINTLYLMINQGNGKWETKLDVIPEQKGVFYRQLMPADIDNDGDMDVVGFIADEPLYGTYRPQTGGVDLFRFEDGVYYYENIVPHEVNHEVWFHGGALADVNNDGWVDVIGSNGAPRVYLNKGNGTFDSNDWFEVATDWFGTRKTMGPAVAIWDLDFVDLNNDGLLDLIGTPNKNKDFFFNHPGNDTDKYQITTEIYYNTGTYPYYNDNEPYRLDSDYLTDVFEDMFSDVNDHAFIDYNNDGYVDIFTLSSTHWAFKKDGVVQYHQNNGDGTFSIHNDIFEEGENELFVSNVTNPTGSYAEGEGGQIWHIKAWDIDDDGDIELLIEGWKYMGFNIWDINSDGKLIQAIY